jgi:hypothetical protein
MEDRRLTQNSQSGPGGRAASLVIVALLLILLIVCSSAGAAKTKPLTIKTAALKTATATVPYDAQLSATGGAAPYSYSIESGSLPAGVTISESGEISGTPTRAGTDTFTVRVTDSSQPAMSATTTYTLPVQLDVGPPKAGPAQVDNVFTLEPNAIGGNGHYTYSIVAGEVPPGVEEYGESGFWELTGYPIQAGTYTFTVQARDAAGDTGTRSFTVKVGLEFWPGEWEARPGAVGQPYEEEFGVNGGSGEYSYAVTRGQLPPGTELREGTYGEEIAGTPTQPGTYSVTITATSAQDGKTTSGRLKIPVFSSRVPLELSSFEEEGAGESLSIWLTPQGESHGVITGHVYLRGSGQFSYDTSNGHLHFTQFRSTEEGQIVETYDVICEPASHVCTGTGPQGAVTLH